MNKVYCFQALFRKANNYLYEIGNNSFILFDAGYSTYEQISSFLNKKDANISAIFLTHAHADHTIDLKHFISKNSIPIYCSEYCAVGIKNSKLNLSKYTDEIPTFEYNYNFNLLSNNQSVIIENVKVVCHHFPGHSEGCMVFEIGDILFTGDFFMKFKTPLNLPSSDKVVYEKSKNKFLNLFSRRLRTIVCYPGHGDRFSLMDIISL